MEITLDNFLNELKNNKIRLSFQRLKVLEYLIDNRCHPTVDKIYSDLYRDIPTLSKTTIYNTLNALVKAKMVKVINIEDNETRYDIDTKNHGHFKCESCGTVYDFGINIDDFTYTGLNNFVINDKNVYFKGVCPGCISNTTDN